MKKVLFATTALVATAGVAAADITFGGYGRFGILYSDNGTTDSTDLTSRWRLQIDTTAESDAGVTFGARTRLEGEERDGAAGQRPQFSGVRYFAKSGGLEVGVGNIFGAIDSMPGQYTIDLGLTGHSYEYAAIGVGGFDAFSSGGLGGSGTNGVEAIYSFGDFKVHASGSDTNDRIAAHVQYTFSGITLTAGMQDSNDDTDTEFAVAAVGSIAGATVSLAYAENGLDVGRTVLMAGYDLSNGATNIHGYIADQDGAAETGYGIGFRHDMGGGTSLRGGVSSTMGDVTLVDLGVRFNF